MHTVSGRTQSEPKGFILPCTCEEVIINSCLYGDPDVDYPPILGPGEPPFMYYNFWYDLLHSYTIIWKSLMQVTIDFYDCVAPDDHPPDGHIPEHREWSKIMPDTNLPQYYSSKLLAHTFQNLITHLTLLYKHNPRYKGLVNVQNLLARAIRLFRAWKHSFLTSHVHIFFGCFRCLGNHELIVNPFICPQTKRKISLDEFLLRFSWDTIGLYHMVSNAMPIHFLVTYNISYLLHRLATSTPPKQGMVWRNY